MKKRIPLYLILFITNIYTLQAQEILNHFDGFKSEFILFTKGADLEPLDQVLIRRANMRLNNGGESAFGLGYETIHLEFICANKIRTTRAQASHRWIEKFYSVKLYDENNQILTDVRLGGESIREYPLESLENYVTYSVELRHVPLILLDKTKKIDITYVMRSSRFR